MVEQTARLDVVFHALSDGTRRGMLQALEGGEKAISDLARPYAMSFAGASKHVKVLETAGLVRRRISGRTHYCSLDAARLREANEWLRRYERFWGDRLDILDSLLRQEDETNGA